MMIVMRVLAVALLAVPVFAAEIPGFALWKASELKKRDEALSKKVGPDHSARETLAEYDDHRLRFLFRDADGFPEQHDNIVDVVFVQSGEGTLHLGGKMIDRMVVRSGIWETEVPLGDAIPCGRTNPLKNLDKSPGMLNL